MDPLTAIGLASNILSFIDFSAQLINGAREIYDSTAGTTEDNKSREAIVSEMNNFSSKLLPPDDSQLTGDEKALCRLAAECNILSSQILDLLGKIKPKDPKSRSQSFWAALKNKVHEKEKLELEKRLENCRGQLELQLNYWMSSETKASLDALVVSAPKDSTKVGQLQRHVEQLRRGVTVTSISPGAQAQLRKLLDISEEACQAVVRERLLKSLAFPDMYGRFEAVETAHYKTFQWIFEDPPEIGRHGGENRQSTQEPFVHWLSSGHGIFHVCGKLGSGKSTLMKYLCNHDRTKTELDKWAGDRDLVMASFFFWKPGSPLQKSLVGLLRSLLYDTLKACPELIPEVLPKYWHQMKSMPWQVQTELHLPAPEIRAAFGRLIEHRSLYKKHCFCFFIDGLDEYEGTYQEDYKAMVELLCSWTEFALADVKICVSSREYNIFMNAFSPDRRLRLQDLTQTDMEKYVQDKLGHIPDESDITSLVVSITEKAQGIFLWVAVVVKRMRELIENGSKLTALQQELDLLPQELDDLFKHILKSLSTSDRKRAYQTFAMLLRLGPYNLKLSLFSYTFLEDYDRDPEFAMKGTFPHSIMDESSKEGRIELARKTLTGCCRGLVEPIMDEEELILSFTHRSVPEFLLTPSIQEDMEFHLKDFNPEDAASQLILAELWCREPNSADKIGYGHLSFIAHSLFRMRHEAKADRAPYSFQENFHSALTQLGVTELKEDDHLGEIAIRTGNLSRTHIACVEGDVSRQSYISTPLHLSAILGNSEYVAWKVERNLTVIDTPFKMILLFYCGLYALLTGQTGALSILELLLRRGLSPQTLTPIWGLQLKKMEVDKSISVWQHFILSCVVLDNVIEAEPRYTLLGQMIEKFLQYGADPHFWISVPERDSDEQDGDELNGDESDGGELDGSRWFIVKLKLGVERRRVLVHINERYGYLEKWRHRSLPDLDDSLHDLVELWQLENKESVLQLLDRNTKHLERASEGGGEVARGEEQPAKGARVAQVVDQRSLESKPQVSGRSITDIQDKELAQFEKPKGAGLSTEIRGGNHVFVFIFGVVSAVLILQLWAMISNLIECIAFPMILHRSRR